MGVCIHSLCAKGLKLTNKAFFRQFRPEPKSYIWFFLSHFNVILLNCKYSVCKGCWINSITNRSSLFVFRTDFVTVILPFPF